MMTDQLDYDFDWDDLEDVELPASETSAITPASDLVPQASTLPGDSIDIVGSTTELDHYVEPFHPIAAYRDQFAPRFASASGQLFQSMVEESGIDVDANEVLNLRIDKLASELATRTQELNKYRTGRVFSILGAAATVSIPFIAEAIVQAQNFHLLPIGWVITSLCAAGLAALAILGAVKLTDKIKPLRQQVADDQAQKTKYIAEATEGLAPLASTYHWNMLDPLTEAAVPGIQLDPYVPSSREFDLFTNYGLQQPVSADSSVVSAQSGSYNGNPFTILQTLNFEMGVKTYTGSLVITWVEMETYTDSNGRIRTRPVTRTQTLVAQVTKPFPTYWSDALVVYGTEATPQLSFSRVPSKLSALEGKKAERRIGRAVKGLEKKARSGTEGNAFTVTANQDFEALFLALNRNDEVQFRVLFTPAAQQQMVEVLREKQYGYGDNFEFQKHGSIILLRPRHLVDNDIASAPVPPAGSSEHWNLGHQRAGFNARANAQFRDVYHALSPIFAVPLLHEARTTTAPTPTKLPAQWEAEAAANTRAAEFQHPESVTNNILKVLPSVKDPNDFQVVSTGFRGVDRMDFVPTLGGDGRIHAVPVPWVEYQPVTQVGRLQVWDAAGSVPAVAQAGRGNTTHRRGLNIKVG